MREMGGDSGAFRRRGYLFFHLAQSPGKTPSLGLLGAGVGVGFGVGFVESCFFVMGGFSGCMDSLRKLHTSTILMDSRPAI